MRNEFNTLVPQRCCGRKSVHSSELFLIYPLCLIYTILIRLHSSIYLRIRYVGCEGGRNVSAARDCAMACSSMRCRRCITEWRREGHRVAVCNGGPCLGK